MSLSNQPLWLKAAVSREGDFIVTKCCVVTGGQFFPIEVRVNVPKLAAALKASGLVPQGQDSVAGFGSFLKKAVKAVTKNKITRAVGKVAKKVANSPIAMVANPGLILGAHTLSKGVTGKGLVKGKLGAAIDAGSSIVLSAAGPAAKLPSVGAGALNFVSPQAKAALGVGLNSVLKAQAGTAISAAASAAKNALPSMTPAARAAFDGKLAAMAPALAKKSVEATKVKASFANIVQKAKAGSADAQLAARVIGRSALALQQVQRLEQSFAGGVPGLLITADGRIVKAPRGKFLQTSSTASRPSVLYRGRGAASLKGSFTAVSGIAGAVPTECVAWPSVGHVFVGATQGWGGDADPANDIDGPLHRLDHPDGRVLLDDYSTMQIAGALTP